jgi:carbamoyltransferase
MKKRKILGINALNHDACVTLLHDNEILFAGHSERYSGIKNDSLLNNEILADVKRYGDWDEVVYFERPWSKKLRQIYAGQYSEAFAKTNLPTAHLKQFGIDKIHHYVDHHLSHASAAYYSSPYKESAIVCIDAIGEWETCTIWYAKDGKFEKRWSQRYPHSLGLWYSAMTQRLGLKPQEDEYILMGMAGWGKVIPKLKREIKEYFFREKKLLHFNKNLHRGCLDWDSEYYPDDGTDEWKFTIAANVQSICEDEIYKVFQKAKQLVPETNDICYGGGVALNCVANSMIAHELYPSLWILPNPGDGGSSLGSAAYILGEHVNWHNCFLGKEILGEYPTEQLLTELLKGNIVGVANGRAEFGPRALGNRTLMADPRGNEIKDKVNKIKKRQEFRPFAPAVLEEHAHEIFEMPVKKSQYMQYVAKCKYPEKYPAICHIDNTSRVQTVSKDDNPNFYNLINKFYKNTGCPMVLNTSLNIKGQPIVNTYQDGVEFTKRYGVKVF